MSDKEYVAHHVPRFKKVRARYEIYGEFLRAVLKEACRGLAPLAIIETRAKALPSFAEKILRKRELYTDPEDPLPPDPLVRMTDLCGGRVIAQTSDQVHSICDFIERAFDIDWPNSEDVSRRLRPTEFGYRSVHYIVLANAKKLRDAGITVAVPRQIKGLKAEVQVRTLLEHAWADMGHDMTYKTELKVPDRIHRQFAVIAAELENVDHEFGRLVQDLAEFKSNFGAYHTRDEVQAEIDRLRALLASDAGNIDVAVKIAQLALALGEHKLALAILNRYANQRHQGAERARGVALTELYWDQPKSPEYLEGRRSLAAACEHPHADAETLCALAETWARDDVTKARGFFHDAIVLDPTEPVTLCRYLEFEVANLSSPYVLELSSPMISNAMKRSRKQIEARVNLPWAWSSLATFHLFKGEPFEALDAIAQVIRLCEEPREPAGDSKKRREPARPPCAAGRALMRMRDTLMRVRCIKEKLEGYDCCERAVLLGLAVRAKDAEAAKALCELASFSEGRAHLSPDATVVILSGGCAPEVAHFMRRLKPHLTGAVEGLRFSLLCGGTTSGISGLAGNIAARSRGGIKAYGYLPRGVREDTNPKRFARLFKSAGADFTPLDPLRGWTDLVAAGVDARRVKLLGYAGGMISRSEYAMALALGARVGIVDDKALPPERQFTDSGWEGHPNLIRFPMDAMTMRAFLLVGELPCKRDEFEWAAKKTHEEYVKSAIPREPSLLPWEKLDEGLKVSNYHQVSYAENILKTAGLGVRPMKDPRKPLLDMQKVLGDDGIRRLAEMEHGRWNVERLLLGWHYAKTKDVAKKHSPYLVPWREVPPEIQQFDLDAIRTLPVKFKEAGLEIYKL